MMGKCYDPGAKLLKVEKAQQESDAKVKKLKTRDTKKLRTSDTKEDQNKEKADASTTTNTEMPELISNDDEVTPSQKQFPFKKPTGLRPHLK